MDALIPNLPKDTVTEIISWLPADSVIQLKLVSKPWYAFISGLVDNPAFVAKHLCRVKMTVPSTSFVFSRFCRTRTHGDAFLLLTISHANCFVVAEELDLPRPLNEASSWLGTKHVAVHCDGIVCLLRHPRVIVLCNPALRESRILPESDSNTEYSALGFGYDARDKGYKLVKILHKKSNRAEVYSLSTDTWKTVNMPMGEQILTFMDRFGTYLRGVCYWLVKNVEGFITVLSFNLSDEEFSVTRLPRLVVMNFRDSVGLTVWNDSVAAFVHSRIQPDGFSPFLEIFTLEDDQCGRNDGASSWTTKLLIRPLKVQIVEIFSFVHGDDLLVRVTDNQMFSYNVRSQEVREVAVGDVDLLQHCDCLYVKSLASVRRR